MRPPILVTGILIPEVSRNQSSRLSIESFKRSRGFTLWEIIVVVIIVTISVSAILFSTSFGSRSHELETLGKDLSKTIRLLYQEAIFENKNYAIAIHQEGFLVLEYNGEEWFESQQLFFRKVQLGEARESNLIIDDLVVELPEAKNPVPHIFILSSGEITAFEWQIQDTNSKTGISIFGDFLGNVLTSDPIPLS